MATSLSWRLKRYGRLVPGSEETGCKPWKVFEADGKGSEIVLTIVEYGYLIVLRGEESLDTIPLLRASDFLKVQQKKDNILLRYTVRGEGRLVRMQFDGSNKAGAVKECSSAVEKLKEYLPVSTQDDAPPPHNQPPTEIAAAVIQNFLGEANLTLPRFYHHGSLEHGDLEPFLRVCLLDPSFPAFVEKVEGELGKLLQD